MKVVYIYLGESRLPGYVLENLASTKQKFPLSDIVFISDNSQTLKSVSEIGINIWRCSNQVNLNSSVFESMNHPMNFRSGFWFNTLARFFALEEYMESTLETEVIQIEADVWLSASFPFEKFRGFSSELAYPLESVGRGAASVLYVGSLQAIKNFNAYCKNETINSPTSTDMTLLGSYLETYPSRVIQLPTAPSTSFFKDFVPNHISLDASSQHSYFEGIFDPLTFGMHLFGVDAKNNRGILKLFTDPAHHILAVRELDFVMDGNDIIVNKNEESTQLYNLHIHSKNIKIFKSDNSAEEILRLISMRRDHEVNQLVWGVFLSSGFGKIRKWTRAIKFFR